MAGTEVILSAGIDIGTSTTKIVISRLSLRNTAGQTHMPRIEITDTEVIYESPIFRTPLKGDTSIDMAQVEDLISREYKNAGVEPGDIQTGAVIITGETATKSNAREMIDRLSTHAGEFLVATAGPDLEGIIAAKGSGAYALSRKTNKTVANIDIGGGTANTAVYKHGNLLGTCTLHVGGKLVEFENGTVSYTAPAVDQLAKEHNWTFEQGESISREILNELAGCMKEAVIGMLKGTMKESPLLIGQPPEWKEDIDIIMFSGGVAECIYNEESCKEKGIYDDIGPTLAEVLRNSSELGEFEWRVPDETVRATVLGAGTQTTEISGSTIQVDEGTLPLRNIPVAEFRFSGEWKEDIDRLDYFLEQALTLYDPEREGNAFAVYFDDIPLLGFKTIQELGDRLAELYSKYHINTPLIIVMERDLAKSLGQSLHIRHKEMEIVCIDQIRVENGDYIDVSTPLNSEVVPVVIKTLTFHGGEEE
ncbi:ethanolamine ammonia-lyase reactivating factor EutA [Salimicrobium humidisoli]|uniref:Ethanolamine utilization protein n=1 Tax=Salimicrobium humidisoli TaxID=2029857 RepID=A0ABX4HP47_9BACI|nr:ethanolamine ammonia-lyase reactivating factor EutA [Salimicrobium humidisoli]PBB04680.1 ethanolamine utilization protein [Salimicrobium humidisoli]